MWAPSRALVLLAVCCVLAGCSGGLGESATPMTVTPATVPVDDPDRAVLPGGIAPDGTVDGARVANAHRAALANTSFTLRVRTRQTIVGSDSETLVLTTVRVVRVAADGRFTERETTEVRDGGRRTTLSVERYGNGTAVFVRDETESGPVSYNRLPQDRTTRPTVLARDIARYLRLEGESVERTTVDGRTVTVIRATEVGPTGGEVPERSDVRVVVRDSGVVETLSVDTRATGGERRRLTLEGRVSAVGTTAVEPPDWIDIARAATDAEDR